MSANLDYSNGRANVAYLASEGPVWHGEGQMVQDNASLAEWLEAAGLEWSAVKAQSGFLIGDEWKAAQDRYNIVRDDTIQSLGEFSGRYRIHQPSHIMEFFKDVITLAEGFDMCAAGSLRGGRVIWAQALYQNPVKVLGEEHRVRLLCTTSFDGSLATQANGDMTRVICNNTLSASVYAAKNRTVKLRHNAAFDAIEQDKMKDDLAAILAQHEQYAAMAEQLVAIKISKAATEAMFKKLLKIDKTEEAEKAVSTRAMNQFYQLLDCYNDTVSEGTEANTGWAAFNAVTRFVDHRRSTRRTNGESEVTAKLDSKWFGQGAALKQAAKDLFLQDA